MPYNLHDKCRTHLRKVVKTHLGIAYGCSSKELEAHIRLGVTRILPHMDYTERRLLVEDSLAPDWLDAVALDHLLRGVQLPHGRALRVVGLPAAAEAAEEEAAAPVAAVPAAAEGEDGAAPLADRAPARRALSKQAFDHFVYINKEDLAARAANMEGQARH